MIYAFSIKQSQKIFYQRQARTVKMTVLNRFTIIFTPFCATVKSYLTVRVIFNANNNVRAIVNQLFLLTIKYVSDTLIKLMIIATIILEKPPRHK